MEKGEIKSHYHEFSGWVTSLKDLSDEIWHQPIGEGKWSIAAVVTHLLLWDKYSLKERFPYFDQGSILTPFPDFQSVNNKAIKVAEEKSKEEIIEELVEVRNEYVQILEGKSEEMLNTSFSIGANTLTIRDYFKDFIEHDLHHQKQIKEVLEK